MTKKTEIPDWETLLAHAALLQAKIPAAILVGGTAAAVHAGHRISFDHDHVVKDLAKNYDVAIRALESIAGWHTHRRVKGKMVLGNVNKIAAGLRNQRRSAPLETTEVAVQDGRPLRLPTIEETLRIKTFLVVDRNATRDYLDVARRASSRRIAEAIRQAQRRYRAENAEDMNRKQRDYRRKEADSRNPSPLACMARAPGTGDLPL